MSCPIILTHQKLKAISTLVLMSLIPKHQLCSIIFSGLKIYPANPRKSTHYEKVH